MRLRVFIRKTHRWLGLLIGLQVVFWVFGGLIMSSFPLDKVHGDHLRTESSSLTLDMTSLVPISDVIASIGLNIVETKTTVGFRGMEYQLTDSLGNNYFYNAKTGKELVAINEVQAIVIAKSYFVGANDEAINSIVSSKRLTSNSTEYRKRLPVWRIEFDDIESSTFYIAEDNGALLSVRGSLWRIFDFVWMLHIMDYEDRTDFNSWLLIAAAAITLLFSLSGGYLVFTSFKRKDFGLKKKTS